MQRSRATSGAVLSGVAALSLYAVTLSPTVGLVDSGELTTAASQLGVAHPPGFPLYILLTHAITRIPLGSIAARANFASALFAALATATLFLLAWRWLTDAARAEAGIGPEQAHGRKRRRTSDAGALASADQAERIAFGGALLAAALWASFGATWKYATVAEVYTLAAWLSLVVCVALVVGRATLAALVFGGAMGVHPAINLALLPAGVVFVQRSRGTAFFMSRRFLLAVLAAASGLAVYLYLPIAAMQSPPLNWGDPQTMERLWLHITGWQYRGTTELTVGGFVASLERFVGIFWQQFGRGRAPVGLILVVLGSLQAFRTHRTAFWTVVSWMLFNVLTTTAMNAGWAAGAGQETSVAEDLDAYYQPTFIGCAIFAAFGAARVLRIAVQSAASGRVAILVLLAATILPSLAANARAYDRRAEIVAWNYVGHVLDSIAPGGLLLTRDWQLTSPLLYAQHVEQRRTDVIAINLNLLERGWYLDGVSRTSPRVWDRAQPQLATYRLQLTTWEASPLEVLHDDERRRALASSFDDLVLTAAGGRLESGRVFLTPDVALGLDGKGASLVAEFRSRFELVPQGLVFELRRDRHYQAPEPFDFEAGDMVAVRHELPDDHIAARRIDSYSDSLANRGLYLEKHGRCREAQAAFERALAIEPRNRTARAALGRCRE